MHCPLLITKNFHQKIQLLLWLELEMFFMCVQKHKYRPNMQMDNDKKVMIKLHKKKMPSLIFYMTKLK